MTLVVPVWYIHPPGSTPPSHLIPYHDLTLIQLVPTTLVVASVPLQHKEEPTPVAKASRHGSKSNRKEPTDQTPQAPSTPKPPNLSSACSLCEVIRHANSNWPELHHIKPLVHETFPNSNIPKV